MFEMVQETEHEDHGGELGKAIDDLNQAENRLGHARVEEAAAENGHRACNRRDPGCRTWPWNCRSTCYHVNEVEKASFKERLTATLQQVWDKAYVDLKIQRKPKDVFQTAGEHPKSLMSYLGLTLKQAREQKVIEDFRFGIASETGGA